MPDGQAAPGVDGGRAGPRDGLHESAEDGRHHHVSHGTGLTRMAGFGRSDHGNILCRKTMCDNDIRNTEEAV